MPQSKNMARLSEDMKRELIAIIGGMKDPRVQGFLTVMRVEVAPDLSTAKVHVSKMGEEKRNGRSRGRAEPRRGPCAQRDRKAHAHPQGAGIPLRGGRRREVCGAHQ